MIGLWGRSMGAVTRSYFTSRLSISADFYPVPHSGVKFSIFRRFLLLWLPVLM